MSRPGFVLEVDDRTPPLVVHEGEGFRLERFPLGTRVVYPPDSLPGIRDVHGAVAAALAEPVGSEPLRELLGPSTRLTIAVDDLTRPLPQARGTDVRQVVLEQVLGLAAAAGVDDVGLVMATGLRRRMTPREIRDVVGERVFRSFYPSGALTNHDAEDTAGLVSLGQTDQGEPVEVHRRAAESDLLVRVGVVTTPVEGGLSALPLALSSRAALSAHHGHSGGSWPSPADGSPARRMGEVLEQATRVFTVEATLTGEVAGEPWAFLGRREWEWGVRDQAALLAARRYLAVAPGRARHASYQNLRAPYALSGVTAGETVAVHERTVAALHRQQVVDVTGQSDVLVVGVPGTSRYSVGSVMNPVLAAGAALGDGLDAHTGVPVVREGGAVIVYHPAAWTFSQLHHPSYVDFFEEVLTASTDPVEIGARFEHQYAEDPWYRHLYRTAHAFHGVHPFHTWYRVARTLRHVGDVIWVGADRTSVARMGFRAASTLRDALEMASSSVGSSPSITYVHQPPHVVPDVTP